jgi:hypothetical protein
VGLAGVDYFKLRLEECLSRIRPEPKVYNPAVSGATSVTRADLKRELASRPCLSAAAFPSGPTSKSRSYEW